MFHVEHLKIVSIFIAIITDPATFLYIGGDYNLAHYYTVNLYIYKTSEVLIGISTSTSFPPLTDYSFYSNMSIANLFIFMLDYTTKHQEVCSPS